MSRTILVYTTIVKRFIAGPGHRRQEQEGGKVGSKAQNLLDGSGD